jgi:hypothetical protein
MFNDATSERSAVVELRAACNRGNDVDDDKKDEHYERNELDILPPHCVLQIARSLVEDDRVLIQLLRLVDQQPVVFVLHCTMI